ELGAQYHMATGGLIVPYFGGGLLYWHFEDSGFPDDIDQFGFSLGAGIHIMPGGIGSFDIGLTWEQVAIDDNTTAPVTTVDADGFGLLLSYSLFF
ncbi:MAG: hypothetical protein OEZ03_02530, partial [Alphaproteobacteria bacterium]|nr:hypothetical protein [Alphaproteobacteria bacterium]